ncbi:UNVERIFIED_CONTAM: Cullin-associated NEDD8-dissociated protein 1, partial [Sesamum radiatum]
SLASSLSDDLLAKATVEVVQLLKTKSTKSEITRTNIQMIGALSRAVGYRFGPHLGDTVPILINYCNNASENDEELREYSLQALESFLLRCPRDISSYCDQILHLTLEFLSHDPNFTDNMEEDTDDESYAEEEDDESANEYTDDEDVSWKVRRAAAKCLAALIVSRPEMLSRLYNEACPKLIDRFKEREENVKGMLQKGRQILMNQGKALFVRPRYLLKQEVPKIVRSVNKQLREKSIKTKVGAFSVLKELVVVLPDCLADHIGSLTPGIEKALCDKSSTSNLKIEALVFTRLVLASHAPSVFHPYIKDYGFDFKPFVHPIYTAIMSRLTNQDQDQAFAVIAASPLHLDLSCVLEHVISELTAFLRKANRALRQATLGTLNTLIVGYGDKIGSAAYEVIVVELSTLIRNKVLPQALTLIRSSLLQGQALLVAPSRLPLLLALSFFQLQNHLPWVELLQNRPYFPLLNAWQSLSLLAGLCSSSVNMLTDILKADSSTIRYAIYLCPAALAEFNCKVIVRQSVDKAEFDDSSVEKITNLLFNHCESEEEGVRNVVAECLGKIALIEPGKLVPALKERTSNPAAFTRATVVIAVKYSIVERQEKIDEILYPEISSFLMLIKDNDRHVRRAAVLALSTAAHNKPNLIKGLLPELLPLLYDQTKELIRTVDLGPFKHTVDDGLELRKAAFECVDTLLDSCLDQVNPSSFIVPYLLSGLDDHYDVKMPCHLILSKLADKCPSSVLAVLDSLVDPLQKTINFRPKQDAVKQEVDRNEDMIRSALRAIASLNRIRYS